MMPPFALFTLLALLVLALAAAWPFPEPPAPELPGRFVPWDGMGACPPLRSREAPSSARDVRPDDFKTIIALGDSISAGLLAKTARESRDSRGTRSHIAQAPYAGAPGPLAMQEHRGVAYPSGMDAGALTLPTILAHYTNVSGGSTGAHALLGCPGPVCVHPDADGLNAAVSGATSGRLLAEAREVGWKYGEMRRARAGGDGGEEDEWAFVNVGIGGNDICAFCLSPNATLGPGTPEDFAAGIRDAVEHLRRHVPRMIVNIIGLFRVSALYKLTLNDPYCTGTLPAVPHLPLECSCALLPGPAGDFTRARMDDLSDAYDTAVLALVRDWNAERDPRFGVVWQPGQFVDLPSWPVDALSPVDCFHPSEAAHRRVAAGLWNRMTLTMKATPIRWEERIRVRCLEEDDRIRLDDLA